MTWIHQVRCTASLFAAMMACTLAASQATPVIRNSIIRFGMSPAIAGDTIAIFNYAIENPDPVEARVLLTLEPVGGGTLYSKEIRVGPRAIVDDRTPVVTTTTENYEVLLYVNGNIVSRDKTNIRLETGNRMPLFLINDDGDFSGTGDVVKNPRLLQNAMLTTVRGSWAPDSWTGFGEAAAVVIVRPDYHEMSTFQFQALIDYVHHGGTVVWIHPQGILEAAATPLREILPVDPIRIRQVEDLTFLATWAGLPAAAPETYYVPAGIPLVEAVPKGNGQTTLAIGELPVIRTSRQGLGTAVFLALDPCSGFCRQHDLTTPIWNHIITQITRAPLGAARGGDAQLAAIQQQLSGFRIPSVTVIETILGAYLLFFVLILILGYYSRRQATAWIFLAGGGVILTLFIFHMAGRLSAIQVKQSASSVTVAAWVPGSGLIGEKIASLFSKADCRLSLATTQPLSLFYPIANRGSWGQTRREAWTSPLRIVRKREKLEIENLNVPARKLRPLALAFKNTTVATTDAPTPDGVLIYGESDLRLEPPAIPAGLNPVQHAYVVMGNGLFPVPQRNGVLTGGNLRALSAVELDTVAVEAANFLKTAKLPVPALALISAVAMKQTTQFTVDSGGFAENDYRIFLLPLSQRAEGDTITIPSEAVALEAAETHTRLIYRDKEWIDANLRMDTESYLLHAVLPSMVAGMTMEEAELELDASNPGGNIAFAVYLVELDNVINASGRATLAANPKTKIPAARQTGPKYFFTGLAGKKRLLNPNTGRLGLLVQVKQKQIMSNALDVERVNRWKIQSLKISVKGKRPTSFSGDY